MKNNRYSKRNTLVGVCLVAFVGLLVLIGGCVSDKDGDDGRTLSESFSYESTDSAKSTNSAGSTAEETSKEIITQEETKSVRETSEKRTEASSAEKTSQKTTQKTVRGASAASEYAYAGFNPKVTKTDGDWKLMLINKNYCLPEGYTVELAEAVSGTGYELDKRVAPHYQKMYDAAARDGIYLTPVSGYRSVDSQKRNFARKINYYLDQGYEKVEATQKASMIVFLPGASEHNAGLAMDIISLDEDFEETKAFGWLSKNAADYGFILRYPKDKISITGATYEPWHWRFVGTDAAKKIKSSGQCLEEYLGILA